MRKEKGDAKKIDIEELDENTAEHESAAGSGEGASGNGDYQEAEPEQDTLEGDESGDTEYIPEESEVGDPKTRRIKDLEEGNLRIRAEFSNYKRRIEREQIEFASYLKGELLKKFLPILDDFKMMMDKASSGRDESTLEGARMIFEKFQQIMSKEGLQKIDALGSKFDPQIHEALMMKTIDDEAENDRIVEVFQEGFTLNERLLHPSKVIVGKYEKG